MTKERLYHEITNEGYQAMLNLFFSQNVVIPKGKNRHPYADVLHEWAEDIEKRVEHYHNGTWRWFGYPLPIEINMLRIKPSEPMYEAVVRIHYADGTYEDTQKYFTYEEFKNFEFPKSCEWVESTKRERKQ